MDNKAKKQDLLIKIACLIFSFGLWLYVSNVENPTINKRINDVPVEIVNADILSQYKLAILPSQKFKINVSIEGAASDVYRVKLDQFKLSVDLGSYALKKGENNIPVKVEEAPNNIYIIKPETLSIKINLDELVEKSVPIRVDVGTKTKSGYYASNPVASPSSATVLGPAQYVNTVNELIAKGEETNVDNDVELTLPLTAVNEAGKTVSEVVINPSTVNVVIPIRKSKVIDINVKTKGTLSDKLNLKSLEATPSKIEVTGDDSELKNISSIDTEPIDLSAITDSKEVTTKLKVPIGIKILNGGDKVNVKVTVETVNQEEPPKENVKKEVVVPVTIKGLKDELKATLSNDKVTVVIEGKPEDINSIKENEVLAEIDLTSGVEGEQEVPLKITVKEGIKIASINPNKIKVTISKK